MVSPFGFSSPSFFQGAWSLDSHFDASLFGLSLGAHWLMPARCKRAMTWSISSARLSMAACGVFSPVTAVATFFHQSCASFG